MPFSSTCPVECIALDLADEERRQDLFARVSAESRPILIVTEEILNYLTEQQVRALANDLSRQQQMRWRCADLASPLLLRILRLLWGRTLREGDAHFQFTPADAEHFFRSCGWQVKQRADPRMAHRLHREVGLERAFRWISYLPGRAFDQTFRFGDTLLLEHSTAG